MARPDPVRLEICHHLLAAVCEEAGTLLQQSAVSPNIRERRDFSVALFDREARLCAQAAHIPVHLGSAADAVIAARDAIELEPGDVVLGNDPYDGGTHLPDLTMVAPLFARGESKPSWFVSCRAHHADVGGATPGSMGIARDLYGEGLVLPPVRIRHRGRPVRDVLRLLLANVRGRAERELDLAAQEASLRRLADRVQALERDFGRRDLARYAEHLMDYTETAGREALAAIGKGPFHARDELEDDGAGCGPLAIDLWLSRRRGRFHFDFSRSAAQAQGGVNANRSVVVAACAYTLRCLCPERLPTNDGLFRLFEIATRAGTIVDPVRPAPVAGGNVETSQRLVDVCLAAIGRALPRRVPASSAGTMSNLSMGGVDANGREFAFYETLPGGAGAGPNRCGRSAVQTHMTNTRNTPIEEAEHRHPVLVRSLTVVRGSGGRGARCGGDGIEKHVEVRVPAHVSFLGERHRQGPPGRSGGERGAAGAVYLARGAKRVRQPSKGSFALAASEGVVVVTPGGGGHGRA